MPIYEYECTDCGEHFEIIQKFNDKPIMSCPSCSGKIRKLVSNCSFQLKGSGWYVTDYAKKSESKSEKKEDKTGGKDKKPDVEKDKTKSKETSQAKAVNQ